MDLTAPIALDIWRALEVERKEQRKQSRLVHLARALRREGIKPVVLTSGPPKRPGGIAGAQGPDAAWRRRAGAVLAYAAHDGRVTGAGAVVV